jgi:protocatechuate 3,4-dioxygenase beta subunit
VFGMMLSGGAPLAGYAIYMWHCTRDGLYSLWFVFVNDGYTGTLSIGVPA